MYCWPVLCFLIQSSPSVQWESWGRIRCCLWALWWLRWERGSCRTQISLRRVCWHIWGRWRAGALKRWTFEAFILMLKWEQMDGNSPGIRCGKCYHLTFQMRAVVLGVMRRRKLKVEQLTVVDVATFGHLICGLYPSEIKRLTPYILRSVKYLMYDNLYSSLYSLHATLKRKRSGTHTFRFSKQP